MGEAITLAVIGGTGLEKAFDHLDETIVVDTPFGPTSEPVAVGEVAGRRVAFLPRHGRAHSLPPGSIPARANAWALASLGVRGIVSSAAVGSLDPALPPATLVIPDQLLDRTRHRADTFFDGTVPGEPVRHLPLADPFCPVLRRAAASAAPDAHAGATVAVIEGPRFSTRAESLSLRGDGAHLVNMTLFPEVALAAAQRQAQRSYRFAHSSFSRISLLAPKTPTAAELWLNRFRTRSLLESTASALMGPFALSPTNIQLWNCTKTSCSSALAISAATASCRDSRLRSRAR